MKKWFGLILSVYSLALAGQTGTVSGKVLNNGSPIAFANVYIENESKGTTTNEKGEFVLTNIAEGTYQLTASFISFKSQTKKVKVVNGETTNVDFALIPSTKQLDEVVISGTMKPVLKLESAVPVEVYNPKFFQANPVPSVYEAMQNVNGVRPQVNCSVCNTGDIHINGLEGAYTMVLIDGMPIVSGLSTVYGLNGIPQSLIERVEIVKGPASTLYGSEAVGGIINVITKKVDNAPVVSAESFMTSWGEVNTDVATKFNVGKKASSVFGLNYFNYSNPIDNNDDGFTDITLQDRISLFNKWNFKRKDNKVFSLAARYVYEDRWGGEMNWTPENRGGTDVYGESIYTSRWEVIGNYQLPVEENVMLMFSANGHDQNSVYGDGWFIGQQNIGFGQMTWDKQLSNRHDLLVGAALRYTYYDDNTPATFDIDGGQAVNAPTHTYIPGVFIQDEWSINDNNKLLTGLRYDKNSIHGDILTPRLNYKWNSSNKKNILRFSFGTGYRVVNVFTEDHAALTGARDVEFTENLDPETSYNGNINFVHKIFTKNDWYINLDATAFYTYFENKIFADYDTDPNKIIYNNLDGFAVSNGVSLNIDIAYKGLNARIGATAMDVYSVQGGVRERQELTEQYTGTWNIGYHWRKRGWKIDYTGNLYGPMELPVLGENDPRPAQSPWWSIQNIQVTKRFNEHWEAYGGVKNLLNWTPWKGLEYEMIARSHDPFDENVTFDAEGNAMQTPNNPFRLTFDPAYVYATAQGIRGFFGIRYTVQ